MAEITTRTPVRSFEKPRQFTLTWDNGSPWTFISESAATAIGDPWELGEPQVFHGLGNGEFTAHYSMLVHFKLKGYGAAT